MKLNLGCGLNGKEGWHNVDAHAACKPDQVVNLETLPWPWPDNSATEVLFNHSLEHMGQAPEVFLGIMRELWRVCAPGALVGINVPDPRHDNFIGDPTHVRRITVETLHLFSQRFNRHCAEVGAANSPLGLMHGVDFEVESHEQVLDPYWAARRDGGEIDDTELARAMRTYNNVVSEHRFMLVAIK